MDTEIYNEYEYFEKEIWNIYSQNLSQSTKKVYLKVVRDFIKTQNCLPTDITQSMVNMYVDSLKKRVENHKLSYSTMIMRISVMRSLCDFIYSKYKREGKNYKNYFLEISNIDTDKTINDKDIPSIKELDCLLSATIENNDLKTFILCSLTIKCGITISEACKIEYDNLAKDFEGNYCIIIKSKSIKRILRIPEDLSRYIEKYITDNDITCGPLFLNKHHTILKVRDAERLLKSYTDVLYAKNVISTKFTFQQLRHIAAIYMLKGGASHREVSEYLGITTKWICRYNQIVDSEIEKRAADMNIIEIRNISI